MLNDDQRGGHDEAGACYGAVRGLVARGEPPEDTTRTLGWLDTVWAEVLRLREENAALALRLERDATTYATMQTGPCVICSDWERFDGWLESGHHETCPVPRAERAEAEVARLREALAPFAALADRYIRYIPNVSDSSLLSEWWPNDDPRQSATVGDCRKAQEALR